MRLFGTSHGKAALLALVIGVSGACDNGVTVQNQNPSGTVGGLVVDATTQQALEGVAIRLLSAGGQFESTTGVDGFYRITQVPAGGFTVELTKDGYISVRLPGELVGAVGNFPISMPIDTIQPVGLMPVGPDFAVRVIDSNGVPVSGAKATARASVAYVDLSKGTPQYTGSVVTSAVSGDDGRLVFKGLPDAVKLGSVRYYEPFFGYLGVDTVMVAVEAHQVMGQENYDYVGGIYQFGRVAVGSTLPQIVMSGPTDPLTILESNVEWLRQGFVGPSLGNPVRGSIVDAAGPITIAFSDAIDPATLRAEVTTESGAPGPALTPTVNLNLVSLAGGFDAGKRYNLYLSATAALNGGGPARQKITTAPFFAKTPDGSKPTIVTAKLSAAATTPPSFVIDFVLSEPIGRGEGSQQVLDCVVFHESPANFDGSSAGAALVAGEWAADASSLSCATTSPVAMVNPPPSSNGRLTGVENQGNMLATSTTGYTTVFSATVQPYVQSTMTTMAAAGATLPVAGGKGHLYFSKLPFTVMRANGEPVGDIPFTLQ